MRVIRIALVVGVGALAGCQTAQQQAKNEAAADDAACRSYGLQFGTPAYAECRQRREAASQQQAVAMLGAIQGANRSQSVSTTYAMPITSPVNTTCSTSGGITNCNSY
jgi:hypothetical protein